jgi:hypothetical protein
MPDAQVAEPRPDYLKRFIDIATLIILVVGLWFAFDQAGKIRDSIDTSTWNSVSTQLLELDKVFIEHPNMRKYFNGQDVKVGDPDYDSAAAIADYYLDLIDDFYAFQPHLNGANYDFDAWHNFFVSSFKNSPVMCRVQEQSGDVPRASTSTQRVRPGSS